MLERCDDNHVLTDVEQVKKNSCFIPKYVTAKRLNVRVLITKNLNITREPFEATLNPCG